MGEKWGICETKVFLQRVDGSRFVSENVCLKCNSDAKPPALPAWFLFMRVLFHWSAGGKEDEIGIAVALSLHVDCLGDTRGS